MIESFGHSGSNVDRLGFITNLGRIFGPYGGREEDRLKFKAAMSEESMDDLDAVLTALDFFVAVYHHVHHQSIFVYFSSFGRTVWTLPCWNLLSYAELITIFKCIHTALILVFV